VVGADLAEDHDERAGRARDLHAAAAEERDEGPGHDRRGEALLGLHPAVDRERHRERDRDDPDDQARERVARQRPPGHVALSPRADDGDHGSSLQRPRGPQRPMGQVSSSDRLRV
jgi:hypothetical protein